MTDSSSPPADRGLRYNAGKPRADLFPWSDVNIRSDYDPSIYEAFAGLQVWFSTKPLPLRMPFPARQVRGVIDVLTQGAQKYADRNWEKGMPYAEVFGCAARHAQAYLAGEHVDRESGCAHESHFWANYLFLLVFAARGHVNLDDRPAPNPELSRKYEAAKALAARLTGDGGNFATADTNPFALPDFSGSKKESN
jgi:hypothetical protein